MIRNNRMMQKMKGIYLASFTAKHPNYDIVYQDINGKRDIGGDMLDVDLSPYDFVIATPPCNYWSRANHQREQSEYAQKTKHLLPMILDKLTRLEKPFIVENVRNPRLFNKYKLYNFPCFVYKVGRHTYWTNMMFNPMFVPQQFDFKKRGYHLHSASGMQGGQNVHEVFELWLKQLTENKGEEK